MSEIIVYLHIYHCFILSLEKTDIQNGTFLISGKKHNVVGTHWKCLIETLPMSTTTNVLMEK